MFTEYTYQDWKKMGGGAKNARKIVESYRASDFFRRALDANRYFAGCNPTLDDKYMLKVQTREQKDADGLTRKVVGIELEGRAIPRHGYEVVVNDEVVGYVTTGYNSISTGKSVCMALVKIDYAKLGTPVQVRIHRKLHNGVVVKKRFYDKSYKK